MTWPTGGPPKINYGNNHSEKKWVNLLQPLYPDDTGKMNYGKSWALPRIMEKKGSDHAWEILNPYEENLIMERNGDRRPLSKFDIFFPIILSAAISSYHSYLAIYRSTYLSINRSICLYIYASIHLSIYPYVYLCIM